MLNCRFQVPSIALYVLQGKHAIHIVWIEARMWFQNVVFVRLLFFVQQIPPLILCQGFNFILRSCFFLLLFRVLLFSCLLIVLPSFLLCFLAFSLYLLFLLWTQLFFVRKPPRNTLQVDPIQLRSHSLLLPQFRSNRTTFFKQLNAFLPFDDISQVHH